jgi:hypothetical protein
MERGQASIEFIGITTLVAIAFAAAVAFVPAIDGRPLGAALARGLVCAVKRDCHAEGEALRHAYGELDAGLVRTHAPNLVYERGTLTLPVDYRECRSHRCSDAPDDRDLDATRAARGGVRATAFTHVAHRGGRTYIQYWLYYPDSPSTFMNSHGVLKKLGIRDPAYHPDDWEAFTVRIGPDGRVAVRASAHGHWQWCKHWWCRNNWGPGNGWSRVSRGSHAGHIPMKKARERSTMAPGIRLIPLETLDHKTYKPLPGGIKPPWTKDVYTDPANDSS